jgi:hypothetical protein
VNLATRRALELGNVVPTHSIDTAETGIWNTAHTLGRVRLRARDYGILKGRKVTSSGIKSHLGYDRGSPELTFHVELNPSNHRGWD